MKSGLEGRNNVKIEYGQESLFEVSMKSGLEGRNNRNLGLIHIEKNSVSMKSGQEGRNNSPSDIHEVHRMPSQ